MTFKEILDDVHPDDVILPEDCDEDPDVARFKKDIEELTEIVELV